MINLSDITIVVPCRNESENIEMLSALTSTIPKDLEIILVEGGSSDNTEAKCIEMAKNHPTSVQFIKQSTEGKMNAVWDGIEKSTRNHIAIFDADLTVPLQDQMRLVLYYAQADYKLLVTGNRLNRQIHKRSMQKANVVGNYFFGILFSLSLQNRIVDTLCGSKIFPKEILMNPSCQNIVSNDPFGDFSILTNAWLKGLKIESLDVEYVPRRYGSTNIRRWRSGVVLLKTWFHVFLVHNIANRKWCES